MDGILSFWKDYLQIIVIVFDNRGIGNTTVGSKNFTIDQFAKDSAGLLDALKINESDVLRYSMGGMIAQQLTLNYPDKVDNLIIYASYCGENNRFHQIQNDSNRWQIYLHLLMI